MPQKSYKFVITGLPRSRTAWFSAYLTQGDVMCYHEAIANNIELCGYPYVGTADSAYCFFPEWAEKIGEHKLVVIHRDYKEVAKSVARIGLPDTPNYLPAYSKLLDNLGGLHINFNEINERIMEIHDYLELPGFDANRAEMFNNMNIQSKEWSK